MKNCSLGFIFDTTLEHVLLVHKNRPAWQAGLLNGVGGKVEADEILLTCMVRECQEETTLTIPAEKWHSFATIDESRESGVGWIIEVFAAKYDGARSDAAKNDHEEIAWFPYNQLPDNVITNLNFLIPMARQKLLGHDSQEILIKY